MISTAPKRRPIGLAARAVTLIVGLLAFTAIGATTAVWFGVERENEPALGARGMRRHRARPGDKGGNVLRGGRLRLR